MSELATRIGARIKSARQDRNLTQSDVADYLGIGRAAYSNIENGYSLITVEHLRRLPKILYKPVNYFLDLEVEVNDDEMEILEMYRALPDEPSRRWVRQYFSSLIEMLHQRGDDR